MGIDITSIDLVLLSLRYISDLSKEMARFLTLGKQEIHIPKEVVNQLANRYILKKSEESVGTPLHFNNVNSKIESLFNELGFTPEKGSEIDAMDYSDYEGANIIHDLNFPVPEKYHNKYDYIFDGGTIEHIFNIPQVLQNIMDMLKIGGIFVSVTCNNNFSGHGMYQFSPEIFTQTFNKK